MPGPADPPRPIPPDILDALEQLKAGHAGLKVRNVRVGSPLNKRTSIKLEDPLWEALEGIARRENLTVDDLVTHVAGAQPTSITLTSAVRTFTLYYLLWCTRYMLRSDRKD